MVFLGWCVVREGGFLKVTEAVAAWWRDGVRALTPTEENYFTHVQKSLDARRRSRVPYLLGLYAKLWAAVNDGGAPVGSGGMDGFRA
eukprot:7316579-Pyramimonas_sp.AAC.1